MSYLTIHNRYSGTPLPKRTQMDFRQTVANRAEDGELSNSLKNLIAVAYRQTTWNNTGAGRYEFEPRRVRPGDAYYFPANVPLPAHGTITNLTPGETYRLRFKAVSASGEALAEHVYIADAEGTITVKGELSLQITSDLWIPGASGGVAYNLQEFPDVGPLTPVSFTLNLLPEIANPIAEVGFLQGHPCGNILNPHQIPRLWIWRQVDTDHAFAGPFATGRKGFADELKWDGNKHFLQVLLATAGRYHMAATPDGLSTLPVSFYIKPNMDIGGQVWITQRGGLNHSVASQISTLYKEVPGTTLGYQKIEEERSLSWRASGWKDWMDPPTYIKSGATRVVEGAVIRHTQDGIGFSWRPGQDQLIYILHPRFFRKLSSPAGAIGWWPAVDFTGRPIARWRFDRFYIFGRSTVTFQ